MKNLENSLSATERQESLEARVALRMAACLNEATEHLPHDITERLRFGREQALARAKSAQRQAAVANTVEVQSNGTAVLGGPPSAWLRWASLVPLAALLVGLVLIEKHHSHEQIVTAAEIDVALLADELPPAAYSDPGFKAFLQTTVGP